MNNGTVQIFDTTLRDGEQSPGASMDISAKLRVAESLLRLNVDTIEAGFPISSPVAFDAFVAVSDLVGDRARVAALARCRDMDIERAGEALEDTAVPRIHVFCATSPIHREFKLRLDREGVLKRVYEGVSLARNALGSRGDVQFSLEDASRTERDFIAEVTVAAIEAGATTINLPDTVGYSFPSAYGAIFANLRADVPRIDAKGIVLSAHCHNDLGMALGNTFEAIMNGARQVECTLNGIGERAGNAQLEAIVMATRLHARTLGVQVRTDTSGIMAASNTLYRATGLTIARHFPIVGRNAFAHESGIHQDGMIKNRETYEIMRPEDVGRSGTDLVLGRHSGKSGVSDRLNRLGVRLTEDELEELMIRFKTLADQRSEIHDEDLLALVSAIEGVESVEMANWALKDYKPLGVIDGNHHATVELFDPQGELISVNGIGDGPIDALAAAIRSALKLPEVILLEFSCHNVTRGENALAEAHVTLQCCAQEHRGHGVDTDTVRASVLAYLKAANAVIRASQAEFVVAT